MVTHDEKNKSLMLKSAKRSDARDVTAEYTLPDYLPDVNRLLHVSAKATIPEKYCSPDTVEYDGKLTFSILYASADSEIRCACFDTDYSGAIPFSDIDDLSAVYVQVYTENASCRLTSPRKLTAKCKLCANASVSNVKNACPVIAGKVSADTEKHLQYRKKLVEFSRELKAEEKSTPISEDLEIDPGMPQIERIIHAELTPAISEVHPMGGKISYSGDFIASILYEYSTDETPAYVSFTRRIPVSGTIEASGISEESFAVCDAEAENISFRAQTGELGETRTVELDFDYNVFMRVFTPDTCELTCDLYSLGYETSAEEEMLHYVSLDASKHFNFTFNESVNSDAEGADKIVCTKAYANITSVERSGGKTTVSGSVSFDTVLLCDNSYAGKSYTLPFKADTDAGRYPEAFSYIAKAYTTGASARISGGKIYFDTEINVCLAIFGGKEANAVRCATVFADKPASHIPADEIAIYYPTRCEDLWSVAKRYHVSTEALATLNGIIGDKHEGRALLIPTEKMPATYSYKRK